MPSYRFCRPDDIPLLVRAVNDCYDVHFPAAERLTVEGFRREMKELDAWPSSAMVALAGDQPIAVLIGTKRPAEALVLRVGVRPDHLRQGHGSHVLTSLRQKLAVLGPPRLVAEVADDQPGVAAFFASLGYEREASYADWTRPAAPVEPVPAELFAPLGVGELLADGLLEPPPDAAWERSRASLANARETLHGVAIATPERIEAQVVVRAGETSVDVLAAGCRDEARRDLLLGLLLRHLAGRGTALRIPKLGVGELSEGLLASLGFAPVRTYGRYAISAAAE